MSIMSIIGMMIPSGSYSTPPPTPGSYEVSFNQAEEDLGIIVIAGPTTFTIKTTGAVAGNRSIAAVTADGVNVPVINGFSLTSITDDYVNIDTTVNYFDFFYDGTNYWVTIYQ